MRIEATPIFPIMLLPSQRLLIIEAVRIAELRLRQLAQAAPLLEEKRSR